MAVNVSPGLRRMLDYARTIFSIISIVTIIVYLWWHRDQIAGLARGAAPGRIAIAGLLFALLHFIIAAAFHFAQAAVMVKRPYVAGVDSYMRRLPARYIPGGVWHSFSRYLDIHEQRHADKRGLLRVFFVENAVVGVSGLGLAAILLGFVAAANPLTDLIRLTLLGLFVGAAAVLIYAARFAGTRMDLRALASALALMSVNWIGVALAFSIFFSGVDAARTCPLLDVAAGYLSAASIGFVAVFAPQGWGVAELVLAIQHPCGISTPVAVASLTGFRVLGALADITLYTCWRLVAGRRNIAG
jgi:glycosyltransferase 2 family protein